MDMLLTGTGPADGFPVVGCPCAVCRSVPGRSDAGRFGVGSSEVGGFEVGGFEVGVLGRFEPFALGPARSARRPAELRLGERYRVDVQGAVHDIGDEVHRLRGGDRLNRPGLDVRALGVDGEPVSLLIRPDGERPLLWAPQAGTMSDGTLAELAAELDTEPLSAEPLDTGPLDTETLGAGTPGGGTLGLAIVGPAPDADPDQPQAGTAPIEAAQLLARLRAIGAVGHETACLLVGLGHRQGPVDRLTTCLQHWRAHAPADGTRWTTPADDVGSASRSVASSPGGRTLVLGGSASGKSGLAEDLLAAEPEVLYTATGPVVDLRTAPDEEWAQRVRRHRDRRPSWWQTEETHQVAELLWKTQQPILLDSIGTWLTGVLDRSGAWTDQDGWRDRVTLETDALVRSWRFRRTPLVAVSDEVGLGVVPATRAGRLFRDELGRLNRRLADESDQVLVVVAGQLLASPPALRNDPWPTGPGPESA